MKDSNAFSVAQLREKLRQRNLNLSGNKTEMILRLIQADPTGHWMSDGDAADDGRVEEEEAVGATMSQDTREKVEEFELPRGRQSERDRELEWSRRENALMKRELEL